MLIILWTVVKTFVVMHVIATDTYYCW